MPNTPKGIFPRNLTARAAYLVPGNPVITRPEDAMGNCYPGLELDVRNLDRRFFPGLVFEFIARHDPSAPYSEPGRYGAKLLYVDLLGDPEVQHNTDAARRLAAALHGEQGAALSQGTNWYLDWIEQQGRRLAMYWHRPIPSREDAQQRMDERTPLDGLFVWRLVRSLEPGPVTINLICRDDQREVRLEGWRRPFTDPRTGVLHEAYQPGELLQSLCSPWQHDFRDCGCQYWASQHPDIVLGEIAPGEPTLPDGRTADPRRADTWLDWLRADRSPGAASSALNTIAKNRPFQLDHFQINTAWQQLNVVLQNTEIDSIYQPLRAETALPFATPQELAAVLRQLAQVEIALAFQYLYALFTVRDEEEARQLGDQHLVDDVLFMRQTLLRVATSEMQHAGWVNEILWKLYEAGMIASYTPILDPAATLPTAEQLDGQPRTLLALTRDTVDMFVAMEHPAHPIDRTYERVIATLRLPGYPGHLSGLAVRIITDGLEHFTHFRDLRQLLRFYDDSTTPWLRSMTLGTPEQTADGLRLYETIHQHLSTAYQTTGRLQSRRYGEAVAQARQAMMQLYDLAEQLARQGIGIPFGATP
ncbi:MAG: ferritin-like domain-containing protein [Candidatus Tectimicrobiota bacterium]